MGGWAKARALLLEATSRLFQRHVVTAALAVMAILVWLAALQLPDGRLHVAFLDVGQGDAILITTPEGRQVLVDGGPNPTRLLQELGSFMPFWDRSLDLVILTHPDEDHMAGLIPLFDRYRVERVLTGAPTLVAEEAQPWREAVEAAGISIVVAQRGMEIKPGRGVRLEVLHPGAELLSGTPSDDNNNSIVLRLVYGQTSALLTGDLEVEGERTLMALGISLAAQVLKVSHHGSGRATTSDFLRAVAPQLAVIQVGANNRFGHPAPEVLKRLSEQQGNRGRQQRAGQLFPEGAAPPAGGQPGCQSRQHASYNDVGAAVRVHSQLALPTPQALQGLLHRLRYRLGGHLTVDQEAIGGGTPHQAHRGEAAGKQMHGGVLHGVVLAHALHQ